MASVQRDRSSQVAPPAGVNAFAGNGTPVCTNTVGQISPAIISDGSGGAVVGWLDFRNFSSDVFCNRLDSNGDVVSGWDAAGVPAIVRDSFLVYCEVEPDGAGGAFLATTEAGIGFATLQDVYVQHVLPNGSLASGFTLAGKSMGIGNHEGFAIRADASGGLYVGWLDEVGQARIIRVDGFGNLQGGWPASGVPIAPAETYDIDVISDGSGGVFFAWTQTDSVLVTHYEGGGAPASGWPSTGILMSSGGFFAEGVRLTRLTGGELMATWIDFRFFDLDLFTVRFASNGAIYPPWSVGGVPVCTATGAVTDPVIASDGSGGAVFAWGDQRGGMGSAIYAHHLLGDGSLAPGWPSGGLAMTPENGSKFPQGMIPDGSGGLFVSWVDNVSSVDMSDDVFLSHRLSDGTRPAMFPASGLVVCDADQNQAEVAMARDGGTGAILAWEDNRSAITPTRVYVARVQGDGTVAAKASLASAIAEPGLVRLTWFSPDGVDFVATLEREKDGAGFSRLADVQADAGGFVRYEDHDVEAGATYHYRLAVDESGGRTYLGLVTLQVPNGLTLAIETPRPNPTAGPLTLAFTLPTTAPATLDLIDVSGRRVLQREVAPSAGRQILRIDNALAPGVYLAKLTQAGRVAASRVVVTE